MLQAFLQDIAEHPGEDSLWLILADWLDEQDDPRGELVRLQHDLRQPGIELDRRKKTARERLAKEDRLRGLLARGVRPVSIRLVNSLGMTFVLLPPGTFLMGSPDDESERHNDECPRHQVTLTRPFYLGIHPVTQEQYLEVVESNPSLFTEVGPLHPVENVPWSAAADFCTRLSELEEEKEAGRRYRLPTEAEWEYACRAGTTTPFFFGRTATSTVANFDGNHPYTDSVGPYLGHTTPVGAYQANAFGLYDVHGNVWEWCQDVYDVGYYESSPSVDPLNLKGSGVMRVLRGGCWRSVGGFCRSGFRDRAIPDHHSQSIGFRVALEV